MKILRYSTLLICMIFIDIIAGYAQSNSTSDASVLLVQLRSENNRIRHFESKGQKKKVSDLKEEAQKIMQAMINDFNDHYTRKKVYYFIDTNLNLIKQREFSGVLLDNKLQPVINPNMENKRYHIVYYGQPSNVNENGKIVPRQRIGKGLVIMDQDYKQVYYNYVPSYSGLFRRSSPYSYVSKKYDMEYFESAHSLEKNFW